MLHQQEFHVTVPTKGDPMKDQLADVRLLAQSIHQDNLPVRVAPLPLSIHNPIRLQLGPEVIVNQLEDFVHRAYASPRARTHHFAL